MQDHVSTLGWIRSHRRFAAIVVALALALTIVAALVTSGLNSDTPVAADDADGTTMVVAGLSWSRMMAPGNPGGGAETDGLSWSSF